MGKRHSLPESPKGGLPAASLGHRPTAVGPRIASRTLGPSSATYFGFHPQTKSKLGSTAGFSGFGYQRPFERFNAWTEPSTQCVSIESSRLIFLSQSYDLVQIAKLKAFGSRFSNPSRRLKKSILTLARRIPVSRISILIESTSIPAGADSPISAGFRKTTQSSARATLDATISTKTISSVLMAQPCGLVGISVIVMENLNGSNASKTKMTMGTNRIQKKV
jgi:hypothetical protein